jgi:hypothetical protein
VLQAGRGVGAHHDQAVVGDQDGVHDLVRQRRIGGAEVTEGVDVQLAAEDGVVELHRRAGLAVAERDVGVEAHCHDRLLFRDE